MDLLEPVSAVRQGAGLFRMRHRGVIEVTGRDARPWLNGMISNDVSRLQAGGPESGCYATLLTRQGRIVADLHVVARPSGFWLETEGAAVPEVLGRLEKHVIADDVQLADVTGAWERLGLEGPASSAILAAAAGAPVDPPPDGAAECRIADVVVVAVAFGWSGAPAFQLFVPSDRAAPVAAALHAAGESHGLVEAEERTLEILRVESGTPRLGRDLDESVLPDEARLERAISTTKGCYTGQEIVARLRSRGRVSQLLVGLSCEGTLPPAVGAEVWVGERCVGEVTSAALSPAAGAIALAYVRRPHDAPGTEVRVGGRSARVVDLPFVDAAPRGRT